MRVFLVRHAVAHARSRTNWPDDSLRPLTAAGKRKFRKVARGLGRLLPKSAPILTSPFVRARETAGILAAVHGGRFIDCQELAHGESPRAVFSLLRLRPGPAVVLIGHEPDLGHFLAAAIGADGARIAFKKGGAACIEFAGRVGAGRAALRWMVSPRILRGLKAKTPPG
jgi:phosphohistidine phosphatase